MRIFLSLLLFSVATSFSALLFSLGRGLEPGVALASLIVGLKVAVISWRKANFPTDIQKPDLLSSALIFCFILFCFRQFLWVYYYRDGSIWTLNESNYGDLPFHIAIIRQLSIGKFWPENPFFGGERLFYSIGADLFTSVFTELGADLGSTLIIQGLVLSLITGFALYLWAGGFGIGAFLFSGGTAGYAILYSGVLQDYQSQLAWKNLALTLLVPQRSFLLGFPMGLFLLWAWRQRFLRQQPRTSLLLEGVVWGVLPLFHVHTFIFVSLIFGYWALATKQIKSTWRILTVAVPLATPLMWILTDGFKKKSMFWLKPGWMMEDQSFAQFLFTNFGLWIVLIVWALVLAYKEKNKTAQRQLLPGFIIFNLLFFVMTSPWEWDNVKFMVWAYLLILPPIYDLILARLRMSVRAAMMVALFFSGAVSVIASYRVNNNGFSVFSLVEVEAVCQAVDSLPVNDRFAIAQSFEHPILLCGRGVVAGYKGHLWSHGIKSDTTEKKLKDLMNGVEGWEKLAYELRARYLYWGTREQKEFESSKRPWEQSKTKVAEGVWGAIYEIY